MSFVKQIKGIQATTDGFKISVEDIDEPILMGNAWYRRWQPAIGDYMTQCNSGFYQVCPKHAFNAIRQVYLI